MVGAQAWRLRQVQLGELAPGVAGHAVGEALGAMQARSSLPGLQGLPMGGVQTVQVQPPHRAQSQFVVEAPHLPSAAGQVPGVAYGLGQRGRRGGAWGRATRLHALPEITRAPVAPPGSQRPHPPLQRVRGFAVQHSQGAAELGLQPGVPRSLGLGQAGQAPRLPGGGVKQAQTRHGVGFVDGLRTVEGLGQGAQRGGLVGQGELHHPGRGGLKDASL